MDMHATPAQTQAVLDAHAADYAALSLQHAASGDARRAALAAWAADLSAVQSLLWEAGIGDAEDPSEPLQAVTGAVGTALSAWCGTAAPTGAPTTVRAVVEEARQALLTAFDESVHPRLRDRFCSLAHLDDVAPPEPGAANSAVLGRLDGRDGEQLVGDLLTAARDCSAVSRALAAAGDEEEARRQAALGDLAGFEAYLVLASAAAGDATLATTDLRWALAGRRLAGPVRRAVLSAVLTPETEVLRSLLDGELPEQVPGP